MRVKDKREGGDQEVEEEEEQEKKEKERNQKSRSLFQGEIHKRIKSEEGDAQIRRPSR